jgi:hypothetical protein
MPVPLTALLAASIHQVQVGQADPASTVRAVSLLARAAGGAAVRLTVEDGTLWVNDVQLDAGAPGVQQVLGVLTAHQLRRIEIPSGVDSARWREVVELFASAPGLYPTVGHFAEALRIILPESSVEAAASAARPQGAAAHRGLLLGDSDPGGAALALGSSGGERSNLSARLDPLIARGREALDRNDEVGIAGVLLELATLEGTQGDAASIEAERRRLAPPRVIEAMARRLPDPGTPPIIARALIELGADAADAVVVAMRDASTRVARRAYIAMLSDIPDSEETIIAALAGTEPQLLADVAEAAGRRAVATAVPALTILLKHHAEEVRTSAWHALEQIGTPAARRALGT